MSYSVVFCYGELMVQEIVVKYLEPAMIMHLEPTILAHRQLRISDGHLALRVSLIILKS